MSPPRRYTIPEARQETKEAIAYLPFLGEDGYVVRGWVHLLAGWWRLGKSELMAAVVLPWLRQGIRVLWITEEPESVWVDRADMMDDVYEPVPWDNLVLVDALSGRPEELLEDAAKDAAWEVLVADTIRECCGIESIKDDDAVIRGVSPWRRRLRDGHRTLVFLAQHRKQEGDSGQRVAGSHALPAMFDLVMELHAVEGHERQRKLTVRRRREPTPPLLLEMDDVERILVVPDGRSRAREETEKTVLAVVDAAEDDLTTAAVRQRMPAPKPSMSTTLRALASLARSGQILRDPDIAMTAERKTVRWRACTLRLRQHLHPLSGEMDAADDADADSSSDDHLRRPAGVVALSPRNGAARPAGEADRSTAAAVGGDPRNRLAELAALNERNGG